MRQGVARVTSVNVGRVREVEWRGRPMRSAIWKEPVGDRPVLARGASLEGDEQATKGIHGGPDKAVYAYAVEDYDWWREAEGIATAPGLFGENLTVEGLDLSAAVVGTRWRVGGALLEVAQPRLPCSKLAMRMGDASFPKRFLAAGRLGAYLRIVEPGELRAGDAIEVLDRPAHGVTLALMAASLEDPSLEPALLRAEQLPEKWRRSIVERATG